MSVDRVHSFRNENVGFIFQFNYLLPELTSLENILLPPRNLGKYEEYTKKALEFSAMADREIFLIDGRIAERD